MREFVEMSLSNAKREYQKSEPKRDLCHRRNTPIRGDIKFTRDLSLFEKDRANKAPTTRACCLDILRDSYRCQA